ncbi:MAG: VIT1/CCC1 transporter family protein [Acidobacteriota bacterium]|nr:VIT1/CCC1 transporter family protein [Acidobacteriota bacterium]
MPDSNKSERVLDPLERFSEVLFGLIMVLTFTCSLRAGSAGREEIRTMLTGALGCNLAWGLIDALMYLMASLSEKRHGLATLLAVRRATNPAQGQQILADALPPVVASVLPTHDFELIRQKLNELAVPADYVRLNGKDWRGAVGVFLLVFLSTFPPVIPFIFITHVRLALRISNAIAIALLALTGYAYGRYAGHRPYAWAFSMVFVGGAMVGLAVALGG